MVRRVCIVTEEWPGIQGCGGIGTAFGPILGALALHLLGEFAKSVAGGIPGIDLVLYGLLLVAVIAFAPGGIMGLLRRPRRAGRQEAR